MGPGVSTERSSQTTLPHRQTDTGRDRSLLCWLDDSVDRLRPACSEMANWRSGIAPRQHLQAVIPDAAAFESVDPEWFLRRISGLPLLDGGNDETEAESGISVYESGLRAGDVPFMAAVRRIAHDVPTFRDIGSRRRTHHHQLVEKTSGRHQDSNPP